MLGFLIRRERLAQNMSQEALCQGICTKSYLSKIETGAAEGSEEIIGLLFGALGIRYVDDAALMAGFDAAFEDYWQSIYRLEQETPEGKALAQRLLALCRQLEFSPRAADAALAALLAAPQHPTEAQLQAAAAFKPAFSPRQAFFYTLLQAAHLAQTGQSRAALALLEGAPNAQEAYLLAERCSLHYVLGENFQTVETGRAAYAAYAEKGHIRPMVMVAELVAVACSLVGDVQQMHQWMAASRNLARYIDDAYWHHQLDYNLGSTLLQAGHYAKAEPLLLRSYQEGLKAGLADDALLMLYQKLSLVYALLGQGAQAKKWLKRYEKSTRPMLAATARLVAYMLAHPNYATSKPYCQLLEDCLNSADEIPHAGVRTFFARFLLDAYKATRQYRKATQLLERYTFLSHGL